jgi:hypothetical protein
MRFRHTQPQEPVWIRVEEGGLFVIEKTFRKRMIESDDMIERVLLAVLRKRLSRFLRPDFPEDLPEH